MTPYQCQVPHDHETEPPVLLPWPLHDSRPTHRAFPAAALIRDHIAERYAIPAGDTDFTDDVHLFDYGYVDSFGAVELVSFVQQAFGITISQSDLVAYAMNTINEIAAFTSLRQQGEL